MGRKIEKVKKQSRCGTRRGGICVLFILLVGLIGITAIVSAKYIQKTENDNTALAKNFYFESDELDGKSHSIAVSADGTGSVSVTLKNYADTMRCSETEIVYNVTVTEAEGETAGIQIDSPTGTLASNTPQDSTVTVSGLKAGKTYTITAATENIYKETLSATFEIQDLNQTVQYRVDPGTAYIKVTVWTEDYEGDVKLTYPAGLIPDNTDPMMRDWKTITSGTKTETFSMEKNSSYVFRFFRENSDASVGSEVTVSAEE